MYAITANVETLSNSSGSMTSYRGTRQLPMFYLNENIQGIVSEEHAEKIALEVIDPTRALRSICAIHIIALPPVPEPEQISTYKPYECGSGKYVLSYTGSTDRAYVVSYHDQDTAMSMWRHCVNEACITSVSLTVKED